MVTSFAPSSTGLRSNAQAEEPAPAAAPRDQHAAVDRPRDRAAVTIEVVLGLVEAE